MKILELPPKVGHSTHYLVNGLIWLFAGFNLVRIAVGWYLDEDRVLSSVSLITTLLLSVIISKTRFKIIAGKFNLHIRNLPEKSWFFAFQKGRHYILLGSMMIFGISLREYSGLDTYYLALIYTIMGSTLVFTSYYFFNQLFEKSEKNIVTIS